jgi:hypothetical protein
MYCQIKQTTVSDEINERASKMQMISHEALEPMFSFYPIPTKYVKFPTVPSFQQPPPSSSLGITPDISFHTGYRGPVVTYQKHIDCETNLRGQMPDYTPPHNVFETLTQGKSLNDKGIVYSGYSHAYRQPCFSTQHTSPFNTNTRVQLKQTAAPQYN